MHKSISNVPYAAKSSNKTTQYVNILLLLTNEHKNFFFVAMDSILHILEMYIEILFSFHTDIQLIR